ncbi:MAG: glycoside hydrolase family 3 N-terminal domain-containing protein [Candidatus Micrarchaeota archaeon]
MANERTSEQLENAVRIASERLSEYISERTSKIETPVIFGPIMTDLYWFRVGIYAMDYGLIESERQRRTDEARKIGIPDPNELPDAFSINLFMADLRGRSGKLIVVKHFPPEPRGGPSLEGTEHDDVIYQISLQEMLNGPMKPYKLSLESKTVPQGTMISHALFPVMEKELKRKHPNIKSLTDQPLPASLSPYIVKGLLRKDLGYEGLVMADWYNMGAISKFCRRYKDNFGFKDYSAQTFIVVLAVYAGINNISALPLVLMEQIKFGKSLVGTEIDRYCQENKDFKGIFDAHVAETLYLKAKNMPESFRRTLGFNLDMLSFKDLTAEPSTFSPEKRAALKGLKNYVASLSTSEKLMVLCTISRDAILPHNKSNIGGMTASVTDESGIRPEIVKMYDYYRGATDAWDRRGLLALKFCKDVIEALTGNKWEDPPLEMSKEIEWTKRLMNDKKFRGLYDGIDWNSPKMIKAYEKAMQQYSKTDMRKIKAVKIATADDQKKSIPAVQPKYRIAVV